MTILKKGILKQINETDILIDGSVNYFDDLPSASSHTGNIYIVQLDQGVIFINKKRAGLYISNGVNWSRLGDLTNILKTSDVVNNLTSTDSDKPLSASQGKILNDNKQGTLTAGANITITNDVISSTLPVAGASIGGVKSGTDITVDASGNVSVNDDSHNHIISNVDGLQTALDGKEPTITSASTSDYYRGDKTFQPLNKTAVGLANVDNTSDLNKPISSATQTALDGKEPSFTKNTAFNKNFGTVSGTVAQGNDSRFTNHLNSFTQNSGQYIATPEIKSRDVNGLILNGVFVRNGGRLGIGNSAPTTKLDVTGNAAVSGNVAIGSTTMKSTFHLKGGTSQQGTAWLISRKSGASSASHIHYGANADWYIRSGSSNGKVVIQDSGGNCGIGGGSPQQKLHVFGNAIVSGSLSKGSGSFDIKHPDPKKKDTHRLRHYFVETPSAGGNIYKYQIECKEGENYIDLPDYFQFLNKDALVWVNPVKHFGRAWGEVIEDKQVKIIAELTGIYNILIFADRKDEIAMKEFNKYGIEYKIKK